MSLYTSLPSAASQNWSQKTLLGVSCAHSGTVTPSKCYISTVTLLSPHSAARVHLPGSMPSVWARRQHLSCP